MVRENRKKEREERRKNKQENQDFKKGANQRKYNYFRIFIINVRVYIACLETHTFLEILGFLDFFNVS